MEILFSRSITVGLLLLSQNKNDLIGKILMQSISIVIGKGSMLER